MISDDYMKGKGSGSPETATHVLAFSHLHFILVGVHQSAGK